MLIIAIPKLGFRERPEPDEELLLEAASAELFEHLNEERYAAAADLGAQEKRETTLSFYRWLRNDKGRCRFEYSPAAYRRLGPGVWALRLELECDVRPTKHTLTWDLRSAQPFLRDHIVASPGDVKRYLPLLWDRYWRDESEALSLWPDDGTPEEQAKP